MNISLLIERPCLESANGKEYLMEDYQAYKEVYFHEYCKKCEYRKVSNDDEPCNECLGEPVNWNTHKPVKYKEKKK